MKTLDNIMLATSADEMLRVPQLKYVSVATQGADNDVTSRAVILTQVSTSSM